MRACFHFFTGSLLLAALMFVSAPSRADTHSNAPNLMLIMVDDMGYSDLGCMGGEIRTPSIDALAGEGILFPACYNSGKCTTSRASLLTGLYHQRCYTRADGLAPSSETIAEALTMQGYRTAIVGKWHLSGLKSTGWYLPKRLPAGHGFEQFYGISWGCSSYFDPRSLCRNTQKIEVENPQDYYFTDAIADEACAQIDHFGTDPFFQYVSFTGPHFPLHIPADDPNLPRYRALYRAGWDEIRSRRFDRQLALGLIPPSMPFPPRDIEVPAWSQEVDKEWQIERMAVYAAMLERVDSAIGKIVAKLKTAGLWDNTLLVFLSDNGAPDDIAAVPQIALKGKATADGRRYRLGEKASILPGPDDTYQSIGKGWANVQNSPLREYKVSSYEGGTKTPLIVHWPKGALKKRVDPQPIRIVDFFPTFLELAGAGNSAPKPCDGRSIVPAFLGNALPQKDWFNYYKDGGSFHQGNWKIVTVSVENPAWELFDLSTDIAERQNLAQQRPERLEQMTRSYTEWFQSFSLPKGFSGNPKKK